MMSDIDRACQAVRTAEYDQALAGRLAEQADLTTGAVTGVVDRLERAGFVRRKADPSDRRSVTIQPDAARAREVRAAVAPLARAIGGALDQLSTGERRAVFGFLDAASSAVE